MSKYKCMVIVIHWAYLFQLTLEGPVKTAAHNTFEYIFYHFSKNISPDISCELPWRWFTWNIKTFSMKKKKWNVIHYKFAWGFRNDYPDYHMGHAYDQLEYVLFMTYNIQLNYHTVCLGFSKTLGKLVVKYVDTYTKNTLWKKKKKKKKRIYQIMLMGCLCVCVCFFFFLLFFWVFFFFFIFFFWFFL